MNDIHTGLAIYFQSSVLPLSFYGTGSGFVHNVHIALQELQAVALILHRMPFHLFGKLVALHQVNSTA